MSNQQQLKKMDFLAVVTNEPKSLGDIKNELSQNFTFVSSFVDYLADHFEQQKRIVKDENGNISLAKGRTSANRQMTFYKVVETEEGFEMISNSDGKVAYAISQGIGAGWSSTPNAAVKKVSKAVFADYRVKMDKLKELSAEESRQVTLNDANEWVSVQHELPEMA